MRTGKGKNILDANHPPVPPDGAQLRLRVLSTTDLHMQLDAYDYIRDAPLDGVGLSGLAGLIDAARAAVPNCLLFDNGDALQGNALGDLAARDRSTPHPMIAAMNRLGYDAATLGNHDFDFGTDCLTGILAEAGFPVVLSNITPDDGAPAGYARYALLRRCLADDAGALREITIGVLGLAPPDVTYWSVGAPGSDLATRDILCAARDYVPRMRAEGANIVIVLFHGGFAGPLTPSDPADAALDVAKLPGVDAIVMGHRHRLFPDPDLPAVDGIDPVSGRLGRAPAVMAGCNGSHLGVIDLTLRQGRNGWHVTEARSALQGNSRPGQDVMTASPALRRAHGTAVEKLRTPLGRVDGPLHSFFAGAVSDPSTALVAEAKRSHLAAELRGTRWQDRPLLACAFAHASGLSNGPGPPRHLHAPDGVITARHIVTLAPYQTPFVALDMTGAQLRLWLERAAAAYSTIPPGSHGPLLRPGAVTAGLCGILGLSYEIDLSVPPGQGRIRYLSCNGVSLRAGDRCAMATTRFQARRFSRTEGVPLDTIPLDDTTNAQTILADWFDTDHRPRPLPAPPDWRFARTGSRAWFDIPVEALGYLDALPDARPSDDGAAPDGRCRVSIAL